MALSVSSDANAVVISVLSRALVIVVVVAVLSVNEVVVTGDVADDVVVADDILVALSTLVESSETIVEDISSGLVATSRFDMVSVTTYITSIIHSHTFK